jgi:predicted lipid-binding transport protein (Tim44 family)
MKKLTLIWLACLVIFAFGAPDTADAAKMRTGSYKSPKSTYTPGATSKAQTDHATKAEPNQTTMTNNGANKGAGSGSTATNTAPNQTRGFFSGGSFMKGLMIGGLAGLLFGGLFSGLGILGDLLGLIVNVLAIALLFVIVRKIVMFFTERKKYERKRFE